MIVMVLIGSFWLLWPERKKDLTLRLKYLNIGVENGKQVAFFRVDGANGYEVEVTGIRYLRNYDPSPPYGAFSVHHYSQGRQFSAADPQYYKDLDHDHPDWTRWKLEADVSIIVHDKGNLAKFLRAIRDAWRVSRGYRRDHSKRPSFLSAVQYFWQANPKHVLSAQMITSDLITNSVLTRIPALLQKGYQSPPSDAIAQ